MPPKTDSAECQWLKIVSDLLNGIPMPPTKPLTNSAVCQWLEIIANQLSGGLPGANAILKDGSVPYDADVIQNWHTSLSSSLDVSGGAIEIVDAGTKKSDFIPGKVLARDFAGTTESSLNFDGTLIQKTVANGTHYHIIGGIKAGAVVPSAANYLEVVIDGVTKKIIIST